MRVLIADDNDLFRAFLGRVIAAYGFCPMFASDGQEALELMSVIEPDLIFTDISMPELDGFGLLFQVRARFGAAIPVVAVTAHWRDTAQSEYIAAGFDWAIEKPLRPEQVLSVLRGVGALGTVMPSTAALAR